MARFEAFEREIKLATTDLDPTAVNRALAAYAKDELRKLIASGQASTTYERFVNGVKGAAEETVKTPGPILYEFINWPLLLRAAISELVKRAPKRSGRYAGGFVVLANGKVVQSYSAIPADAEVVIFNARPYTRKMEVGANKSGRRHFELTQKALATRFRGVFSIRLRFLTMQPGIHPEVPYRLRRSQGRRKNAQAGAPITYPSLVMKATD